MKQFSRYIILIYITLLIAGCSPLIKTEQPARTGWISLTPGTSLGQTFVARYDGLAGISLNLKLETPGSGRLLLHLRENPEASHTLATADLDLQRISTQGYARFQFSPIKTSKGERYYFEVILEGDGKIQAGTAAGETYLNGALYQNGEPRDAQLNFRLAYDPPRVLAGLLREGLSWMGWILAALFLFILPGWAAGLLLPGWSHYGYVEKLGLAAGIGMAFYPVLLLTTGQLGLHLGVLYSWIPPLAGLVILLWRNRFTPQHSHSSPTLGIVAGHSHNPTTNTVQVVVPQRPFISNHLPDLLFVIILGSIFFTRFWAIRSLDAPLWGDSYQHTMMAQLMRDNQGMFSSWGPYVPYRTLTVQFGFPAMVAVFDWLIGIGSLQATLVFGQVINVLAVLTIYPLAARLAGGNRWAGVGAVLVAGLLSPIPGYFVNWGRYAQLAGQAILPVALWLIWEAGEAAQPSGARLATRIWRTALLAGLTLAGMALTYYRMPFYVASFMLTWLVAWGLPRWKLSPRRWLPVLASFLATGVFAGLVFLPWLLQITGSYLASAMEGGVGLGSPVEAVLADFQSWREWQLYLPPFVLALTAAGLLWSLVRKQWFVTAQALWVGLLSAYVAGRLLGLPGANMMQNFAILIAVYLPASLLSGWLLGELVSGLENRLRWAGQAAAALGLAILAVWGAWTQRGIARPDQFAILTRPDLQAQAWIQKNTPEDARFLVQGFPIYDGTSAVGSDGGWWISLLGRRENTMPPQYALINESPVQIDYSRQVVDLANRLGQVSLDTQEGLRLLCDRGITYIYNGQRHGLAGVGAVQLYTPEELERQPAFHSVYRQDRISIYALDLRACEALR